jgi:hypothetical protein
MRFAKIIRKIRKLHGKCVCWAFRSLIYGVFVLLRFGFAFLKEGFALRAAWIERRTSFATLRVSASLATSPLRLATCCMCSLACLLSGPAKRRHASRRTFGSRVKNIQSQNSSKAASKILSNVRPLWTPRPPRSLKFCHTSAIHIRRW